jgi:hypothetical protein
MDRRSFIENSAPDLYLLRVVMSIIDEIWVIHLQKVDTLLMIGKYGFIYS